MTRLVGALFILVAFATAPALAKDAAAAPEPEHGHDAHGHGEEPHGEAGHADAGHGEDHGEDHGGHHYYTDDDDGDGVPNWRDSTNGSEPNTDTYVLSSVGFHMFNFVLLLGVLGYALRRPVMDTFRTRATSIRKELTDSARSRDEAHQRHQDLVARLEKIETEVQGMHTEATADAAREEQKLIERAERESTRIAEQAERSIREETTRARNALRAEAVDLAVQLAEATLRNQVASEDQQTLAREFLQSVKSSGAQHG